MASAFGIAVTNLMSKFGIVSRKAAIRLATETGYKLVDTSTQLGRNLAAKEVQSVFEITLPKKLRPKLLGSRKEIEEMYKNLGYSSELAHANAYNPNISGGCIPAGSGKNPIFVETEGFDYLTNNANLAHELEHALERNNSIRGIIARRVFGPIILPLKRLFNKNFVNDFVRLQGKVNNLQFFGLQSRNRIFLTKSNKVLSCEPTTKGIMDLNSVTSEEYLQRLKTAINEVADSSAKGSKNNTMFKLMKATLDAEIPAYTVGGRVQEYAYKLGKGQTGAQTGTSIVYKDALKLVKSERRLYLRKKLLGKLGKPTVFQTDKDIIRLVTSKEDKILVKNMIRGMNEEQKIGLFEALRRNPNALNNIKAFREATKVNGKYIYDEYLSIVNDIKPEILENPDFMKIVKIIDFERPAYVYQLEEISKASPERIKQFAELADKRVLFDGEGEVLLYDGLSECINSPKFDTLKKLVEIKVGNRYPYRGYPDGINRFMTNEQAEKVLEDAIEASKKGECIEEQIGKQIDEIIAAKKKATFVKVKNPTNNLFACKRTVGLRILSSNFDNFLNQ